MRRGCLCAVSVEEGGWGGGGIGGGKEEAVETAVAAGRKEGY